MNRHSIPLGLILLVLPLVGLSACGGSGSTPAPSGSESAKKYPILLERAPEPGKEYRVRLKDESSERAVMRSKGQVVKEQDKTKVLSFVGTRKVLSAGKYQPAEYVVEELTQTLDGQASVLLPPGTKILASPAGKEWRYTVEQQPLPEEVDEVVGALFGRRLGGPGDDDIFGTKQPRAIGEHWPVDPARLPADDDIAFDPATASGSTRVVALRTVEGVECLEIEAKLSLGKVTLKKIPAEAEMLEATMSGTFLGLFPTDQTRLSLSQGMSLDMTMRMEVMSPSGPIVADMTMHSENTVNRDWYQICRRDDTDLQLSGCYRGETICTGSRAVPDSSCVNEGTALALKRALERNSCVGTERVPWGGTVGDAPGAPYRYVTSINDGLEPGDPVPQAKLDRRFFEQAVPPYQ